MIKYFQIKDKVGTLDEKIICIKEKPTPFELEIISERKENIGKMEVINSYTVTNSSVDIAKVLNSWRRGARSSFITTHAPTLEETELWIKTKLIGRSNQLLFMVIEEREYVGHLGFKFEGGGTVMLDNALKGVRSKRADLFYRAHVSLGSWLFSFEDIKKLVGVIKKDNAPGIMMNKRFGWTNWESGYVESASGMARVYNVSMTKAEFKSIYG